MDLQKKAVFQLAISERDSSPGQELADEQLVFVLSTSNPDRANDIIVQDFDLAAFAKNPIALFEHDTATPIGTWTDLEMNEERTRARFVPVERGLSPQADQINSLVRAGILRAVSARIMPGQIENRGKSYEDGFLLSDNELLEASIVSVPMNGEALIARSLDASQQLGLDRRATDRALFESRKRAHQIERLRIGR